MRKKKKNAYKYTAKVFSFSLHTQNQKNCYKNGLFDITFMNYSVLSQIISLIFSGFFFSSSFVIRFWAFYIAWDCIEFHLVCTCSITERWHQPNAFSLVDTFRFFLSLPFFSFFILISNSHYFKNFISAHNCDESVSCISNIVQSIELFQFIHICINK